jgi:hypothetical protein
MTLYFIIAAFLAGWLIKGMIEEANRELDLSCWQRQSTYEQSLIHQHYADQRESYHREINELRGTAETSERFARENARIANELYKQRMEINERADFYDRLAFELQQVESRLKQRAAALYESPFSLT